MESAPDVLLDKARRFRTPRVEVTDPPCLVLLGRLGDVINALPIAWKLSQVHGKPVPFVVSKRFADPVLAASYVVPEIWDGDFFNSLNAAVKSAIERHKRAVVLQTNGDGYTFRKSTLSFCTEAYALSGFAGKRGQFPLVFDRRNKDRETELVKRIPTSKPLVLYNFTGQSSPLECRQAILSAISKWSGIANFIDLAKCGATSIVDLLALYEMASALLTIDTATLHLAAACNVPYVAFVQDKDHWYGSVPLGNCKLAIPYQAAERSVDQINQVLDDLIPRQFLGAMRDPELTISIACHNRLDVTKACLESLYRHTCRFDLVITDNASTDGTGAWLAEFQKSHPNLSVVRNDANLGFQIPHNLAFSRSETPYFCVLNNDTIVPAGWWPKTRVYFQSNPKVALIGNDTKVCSQIRSNFDGFPGAPEAAEYVEGSLLIARSALVRKVGGLFAPYIHFAYGEDSDLSLRVREAGYRIKLLSLGSEHIGGQTLKTMAPAEAQKVIKFQRANHETLMCRWNVYLRKRNFDYDVLIRRNGGLGDVIAITPVIEAMAKKWPKAKIRVLTQFKDVFQNNPHVIEAASEIRANPDFIYNLDLAYEKTPKVHIADAYARACHVECPLETARVQLYQSFDPKPVRGPTCAIHVGPTGWPGRDWPLDRWRELIKRLPQFGFVQVGSNAPLGIPCAPVSDLQALAQSIAHCSLFIGIDSGPSWVAQAVGVPSVVLFGTIDPKMRLLPAHGAIPVQADPSIAPCVGGHHRLPPPIVRSDCKGECMNAITVEMVLNAVNRAIKPL